MARRDRQCLCCGTKYSYCPTCSVDKSKPTWMTEFCSESCKELFETAIKYNLKAITKDEAKEIIEKIELKERSAYVKCVQNDLENILAEEPVPIKEVAPVEEKTVVAEIPAPVFEEKPAFAPKKKQKSHEVVKKENK